jgi:hypothetical protein
MFEEDKHDDNKLPNSMDHNAMSRKNPLMQLDNIPNKNMLYLDEDEQRYDWVDVLIIQKNHSQHNHDYLY